MHSHIKKHLINTLRELLPKFISVLNQWDEQESAPITEEYSEQEIYNSIVVLFIRCLSFLFMDARGLLPSIRHEDSYPNYNVFLRTLWELHKHGVHIQVHTEHHRHILDVSQYPLLLKKSRQESIPFGYIPQSSFPNHLMQELWAAIARDEHNTLIDYRLLFPEDIGYLYEHLGSLTVARSPIAQEQLLFRAHIPSEPPIPIPTKTIQTLCLSEFISFLHTKIGKPITSLEHLHTEPSNAKLQEKHIQPFLATQKTLLFRQLYVIPNNTRRNLGAHYTPIDMIQPIVENTLAPILEDLRAHPTPDQILHLRICDPAMGSGAFLIVALRILSEKLLHSWQHHNSTTHVHTDSFTQPIPIPSHPKQRRSFAKQLICMHCLFGIDKNPVSVDICTFILWLETASPHTPFSFMDHACHYGDALVGLSPQQISAFHWNPPNNHTQHPHINTLTWKQRGDAIVSTFFMTHKPLRREKLRHTHHHIMQAWEQTATTHALPQEIQDSISWLRQDPFPIVPIHWETLFPEIFLRENPGFDAIVGNPPFCGKNTITMGNRKGYMEWLKIIHPHAHGNSDIVAHFFKKSFDLIRKKGCVGLIATNTIGQGDTRTTGLQWIVRHGGQIYRADKRVQWPSDASVIVSIVYIQKEGAQTSLLLDGAPTSSISSFLFHDGGEDMPKTLSENKGICFQGCITLGMGFTFDEKSKKNVSSLADMHALIHKDPRNQEKIFPYIGGSELNEHPTHAHHRFVIDFFDLTEAEARKWPDLMSILEEKVKPSRALQKRKVLREKWWQYADKRPGMRQAIANKQRVLVTNAQASLYLMFSFLPTGSVFANSLNIFSFDSYQAFAILQSQIHAVFAWFYCSTLGEGIRYNPTDCFETFPFPHNWKENAFLEDIGTRLYHYRSTIMIQRNVGLTKIYGLYHNPNCQDSDIHTLRGLHEEMDKAVLQAYGWDDIQPEYQFTMIYDIDEHNWKESNKKPYQYCWTSQIHDVIIMRVQRLNLIQSTSH